MAKRERSVFLAGDAMITRPWSNVADPRFLDLVAEIRGADVAILNLETVIHQFEHPAQAESGGTWAASPPSIAAELKWAGIDMVAHANNHTSDYGPGGVLETLRHATDAGLVLSGSGADLQSARAAGYFEEGGFRVAHLAMASTFIPYGKASRSRPDLAGRPGLNPLALRQDNASGLAARLRNRLGGRRGREKRTRPVKADGEANLATIREAAANADVVIVSVHAHRQGPWLADFAHRAIDAGAGAVLAHGPHDVQGIELRKGKPIFYGLGDFVYEPHAIARFPQEAYDKLGLPEDATADELRVKIGERKLATKRETFEGAAAILRYGATRLERIELLPIDLQFDAAPETRGRPQLADGELGRRIVGRIAERSAPLGTKVAYDAVRNRGVVEMPSPSAAS